MRRPLLLSLPLVALLVTVPATAAPVAPHPPARPADQAGRPGPPTLPPAYHGQVPASSGDGHPSAAVPTGPARPGPFPHTLEVRNGARTYGCTEPADPYHGAAVTSIFGRPGIATRRYTHAGRTPLFVSFANLSGRGPRAWPGPMVGPTVTTRAPVRTLFTGQGARVGTNGDFFNLGSDGSALGVEILRHSHVIKGTARHQRSFIYQRNDTATVGSVWLTIHLAAKRTIAAHSFNSHYLPADGIAVFTSAWGTASRRSISTSGGVREFVVARGGRVVKVNVGMTSTPVPAGGLIIAGVGRGLHTLGVAGIRVGAGVRYAVRINSNVAKGVDTAIGVGLPLLHASAYDGTVCSVDRPVARTIMGTMPGGKSMVLVVVQGQTDSQTANFRGMTVRESIAFMKGLGVQEAVMLDGGGSACMVLSGTRGIVQLTQSPDGWNRYVPNGYGFWGH